MILENLEFMGYHKYSEFSATLWLKRGDWKIEIDGIPEDIIKLKNELGELLVDIDIGKAWRSFLPPDERKVVDKNKEE